MALSDIVPVNRKEEFLQAIADKSGAPEPVTRIEEFLKRISESSGGSSLPEYTAADLGKVVAVVSNDVIIVPEQTLTIPVGARPPVTTVSGANSEYFVVGQSAIMTINGTPYPVTADLSDGLVEFHVVDPDETHYILLYLPSPIGGAQPGVYFQCSTYGEDFIISLTMPGDIGYGLKNIDNNLPDAPAGDGVYDLVVTNGVATWERRAT